MRTRSQKLATIYEVKIQNNNINEIDIIMHTETVSTHNVPLSTVKKISKKKGDVNCFD